MITLKPMTLLAVGINYNTAPVAVRERLAFPSEALESTLKNLWSIREISEAAILSTCNRTEFYCQADSDDQSSLVEWIADTKRIKPAEFTPYLYSYKDSQSIRHMFRVACGLDSMILGEPQILGQMKTAYHAASQAGTLGRNLSKLFQHTFRREKGAYRYGDRLQPGFRGLRRGATGAANLRQAERPDRTVDRRRRNHRTHRPAFVPTRHRPDYHRQPHLR